MIIRRSSPVRGSGSLFMRAFRGFLYACLAGALGAPAQSPLSLFNGTSLLGWNAHGTWSATSGALTTSGGGPRHVLTAVPFADMNLQFEYNESAAVGAKLRLFAGREANGGFTVDLDNTGAAAGVGGIEGSSKSHSATVSPGWHRIEVEASHGQLNVKLDGIPAASAGNLGSRAGYLGFAAGGDGTLQIRSIRLTPLNLTSTFNNADLGGWKAIARGPESNGGVGHAVTRTLTFGLGGGSTKPHMPNWTVRGNAIHGEDGPGGLENGSPVEDAVLQISASVHGNLKPDTFTGIALRDPAGQLGGGYLIGVGQYSGSIAGLNKRGLVSGNGSVDQTVVIAGRTIAVWVAGNLTTVQTDSRPESGNVSQGAKTSAGSMTLVLPSNNVSLDVQKISLAALPKNYGASAAGPPPPPPPPPVPVATVAPVQSTSPAETALLQQQQTSAKEAADNKADKQRTASLMSQALGTTDPQQQMNLYSQVVQIDPSNAAAVQGFKEAQTKVQGQQLSEQKAAADQVNQQQTQQTREQQTNASLVTAQGAFLGGHLSEASSALSMAERLSPGNPLVRDLRSRISAASSLRSRMYFLGSAAGVVGLLSLILLWRRRRKQSRYPVLELTRGLDSGEVFPLNKDVVRIGAVPQDGGQKNDIVIRDVEHAISRFHCEIQKKNGLLYVTDLKSSNGTRINGKSLEPGRPELLRKGAKLTLANAVDLNFAYARSDRKPNKATAKEQ